MKLKYSIFTVPACVAIVAFGGLQASVATAEEPLGDIIPNLNDPLATVDSGGNRLDLVWVSENVGEQFYGMTTVDGVPVVIHVLESTGVDAEPVVQLEEGEYQDVVQSTVDPNVPSYVEEVVPLDQIHAPTADEFTSIIATAATPESIGIVWSDELGPGEYSAAIDGYEPSVVGADFAIISNIDANDSNLVIDVTPVVDDPKGLRTSFSVPVEMPVVGDAFQPFVYQQNVNTYIHKTFIADSFVYINPIQAIPCGGGLLQLPNFAGDNRGFKSPPAPGNVEDYRTLALANVSWNETHPVSTGKGTGVTKLYDKNTFIDSKRASTAGISFTSISASSSYAKFTINHNVTDPFCTVGGVVYNETVELWRSGSTKVTGSSRPVPHHEAYVATDNGWRTLFQKQSGDFWCLAGACAPWNYSHTANY